MSKWIAVMALGAAMAAAGCDKNKHDGEPMKMSGGAAKCGDCDKAAKAAAEPKKLSAGAATTDSQKKCPSDAAKAKAKAK